MDNRDLYQSQVDLTLSLCSTIYQMAANAKANKNNCQQVAQRVKVLEGLVHTAKQREHGVISPTVENALKEICSTLKSAKTLMEKFSRNNSFSGLRKSGNHDDQFSNVDETLIDNLQVLSRALLIDQGKDLSSMPPMAYNTTTTMSQPMNMAPMGYNPTVSMPKPRNMPPMTSYNPTAAMPQLMNMARMGYNPTASMPQPMNMAPMGYNPTTSMPQPRNMAPMTSYNTPTPALVGWLIPSMETSNSMSSIPFSTPIGFSTLW
ncbi:uncharacterized protein LOC116392316 [Anarrhichthys ocellatus]|uniref:uncharacterized protein LOC116392316 n=1 Tax=Anarrhichthys ocellatus TaxID=433405 RepID=UPI0012ECFB4E|nr:uncharacterized protein LOC116392316 [Anarrhichthys ocellatus]